MSLKEQLAQDADVFLNTSEFAEPLLYNGASIQAVLERGLEFAPGNTFTGEGQSARAELQVAVMDVPSPKPQDIVETDDGICWQVARILDSDAAMHRLELISQESPWR